MAGAAGLTLADDLLCAAEVKELHIGAVAAQLVAVLAFERGAAHDAAVATAIGEPLPDRLEPRIPVVVVERLTGRHLGDVGLRMKVVRIRERHSKPLRERRADGRLTGARDPHDDDW